MVHLRPAFFATTINYIDRQVIAILKPVLDRELHISQADFGFFVFGFQLAYALLMPFAGRLMDAIGTRLGYALAVLVWSIAAMGHAAAGSAFQFGVARFFLGAGESANFPAAFRAVADWFPRRERALAAGIFNSGSNIGALIAPLLVPFLAVHFGWHSAFLFTGASGPVVDGVLARHISSAGTAPFNLVRRAGFHHFGYGCGACRSHSLATAACEKTDVGISAGQGVHGSGLVVLSLLDSGFSSPQIWPEHHGDRTAAGCNLLVFRCRLHRRRMALVFPAEARLDRRFGTQSRNAGLCGRRALGDVCPLYGRQFMAAVILIAIAASAHQGWSANLFTIPSDTFPRSAVGSVIGLGGFGGALAGMVAAPAIGLWLKWSHDRYAPLFIGAGLAYLVALAIIQLLIPRFEQVNA